MTKNKLIAKKIKKIKIERKRDENKTNLNQIKKIQKSQ